MEIHLGIMMIGKTLIKQSGWEHWVAALDFQAFDFLYFTSMSLRFSASVSNQIFSNF